MASQAGRMEITALTVLISCVTSLGIHRTSMQVCGFGLNSMIAIGKEQ